MDQISLVLKIVLVVLPYDLRVYPLYFVKKMMYALLPKNKKNAEKSVCNKYPLFERFKGFEMGSVDALLE